MTYTANLVQIDYLFKIKAFHSATYYHFNDTKFMLMGKYPTKLKRLSDGVMEVISSGNRPGKELMTKTQGVEVLQRDLIRIYFEAK